MQFIEKLRLSVPRGLGLCVGLDPVLSKLPAKFQTAREPILEFNLEIIDATKEYASAYKPNLAFYEAHGDSGWRQLKATFEAIPPDKIKIADAKRGDIDNTSNAYAEAIFRHLKADATTVNPYLGSDALAPFIKDPDCGAFILAVTSNRSGRELQELNAEGKPVFHHVISMANRLSENHNVGLVVGATRPEVWPEVISLAENLPLLIPGIGSQGGEMRKLQSAFENYPAPVLVNVSRSITYASSSDDFKSASTQAAREFHLQMTA